MHSDISFKLSIVQPFLRSLCRLSIKNMASPEQKPRLSLLPRHCIWSYASPKLSAEPRLQGTLGIHARGGSIQHSRHAVLQTRDTTDNTNHVMTRRRTALMYRLHVWSETKFVETLNRSQMVTFRGAMTAVSTYKYWGRDL